MLLSIADSAAQAKFNKTDLKQLRLPQPPIEEQKKISDYLDNKCSQIDKLIEYREKMIERLEEYKKSIIYEYVTGKKEVKQYLTR
jgi:type I restriction enzyme S subunit